MSSTLSLPTHLPLYHTYLGGLLSIDIGDKYMNHRIYACLRRYNIGPLLILVVHDEINWHMPNKRYACRVVKLVLARFQILQ